MIEVDGFSKFNRVYKKPSARRSAFLQLSGGRFFTFAGFFNYQHAAPCQSAYFGNFERKKSEAHAFYEDLPGTKPQRVQLVAMDHPAWHFLSLPLTDLWDLCLKTSFNLRLIDIVFTILEISMLYAPLLAVTFRLWHGKAGNPRLTPTPYFTRKVMHVGLGCLYWGS